MIFNGLSKFGFFYLPCILSVEDEYRLLVSREKATANGFDFQKSKTGNYEFIKFPLFNNPLVDIKLVKIIVFNKSAETQVTKILKSNIKFSSVKIQKDYR